MGLVHVRLTEGIVLLVGAKEKSQGASLAELRRHGHPPTLRAVRRSTPGRNGLGACAQHVAFRLGTGLTLLKVVEFLGLHEVTDADADLGSHILLDGVARHADGMPNGIGIAPPMGHNHRSGKPQ